MAAARFPKVGMERDGTMISILSQVWIDVFAVRQWPGNAADLDFRGVIAGCRALLVCVSTPAAAPASGGRAAAAPLAARFIAKVCERGRVTSGSRLFTINI